MLVEGNADVDRLRALGFCNVVAPTLTVLRGEADATDLRQHTNAAVVFFDNDAAGVKAARTVQAICATVGIVATIELVPRGFRDPATFGRSAPADAVERIFGPTT